MGIENPCLDKDDIVHTSEDSEATVAEISHDQTLRGPLTEFRVGAVLLELPEVIDVYCSPENSEDDQNGVDLKVTMADINGGGHNDRVNVQVKSGDRSIRKFRAKLAKAQTNLQERGLILINGGDHGTEKKGKTVISTEEIKDSFVTQYLILNGINPSSDMLPSARILVDQSIDSQMGDN